MGVIVDVTVVEYSEMNYSGQKFCSPMHGSSAWWFAVAVVAWNSVWGNLQQQRIHMHISNEYMTLIMFMQSNKLYYTH